MKLDPLPVDPVVTIVVPMLNERGHIDACLDGFASQTYGTDRLDVVVVDGGSSDGSREMVERRAEHEPWVRLVCNPDRYAAAAFNRGVEAARGQVLCLFSAHGVPAADYVERSVAVLRETGAAGVGGHYLHRGTDRASSSIGLAMVSWFGMASPHRSAETRQEVDTISHPAYHLAALHLVGPFNERLLRNEDYELNWRIRRAGGQLLVDPSIASVYRPRNGLRALGRQFWWYGKWKARVMKDHPGATRPRHLVPPAAIAFVASAPVLLAVPEARPLVGAVAALYACLMIAAVSGVRPRAHGASTLVTAAAFPVMHACWGAGVLYGLAEDRRRRA